jgi:predicted RNase H-like nuclease
VSGTRVVGIDGCPAGWIAVSISPEGPVEPEIRIVSRFAELIEAAENAVLAVDMPIGLPDFIGPEGRGPERLVRKRLGERQSSVFSVPCRSAVMTEDYREACAVAAAASDPPRMVSKQCFHIFPKMREIDALMTPALETRVYEVHPELAFWRLNGEEAMSLPKKVKSRPNPAGLDQRRELLVRHGYEARHLANPQRGAAADDLLDAAANALIAQRLYRGEGESFPAEPARDSKGLRIAIWA